MIMEEVGHPAHNSFIHSFAELGLFGGTLFVGAFYVAIEGSRRLGSANLAPGSPAAHWRPCVLAIVTAYAVGLCSLSRSYAIPTYVVLGLGAVYLRLAGSRQVQSVAHVSWQSLRRVTLVAAGCLLFFEVFVRVAA